MKKLLILTLVFYLGYGDSISGQQLIPFPAKIINNIKRNAVFYPSQGIGKTTSCPPDTVAYTVNKSTAFWALPLSGTNQNAFAQWYPAPQTMTVGGFEFFGWLDTNNNAVVQVKCRIYNANPNDSLPLGAPLATALVNVDSNSGSGTLSPLRKHAVFPTPVIVSGPYVLTIESSDPSKIYIVSNDYTSTPPNGASEWLSSVKFPNGYRRSYFITVGSSRFNADFIFEPFVSTSITADITPSTTCNQGGNLFTFLNNSSSVYLSKFYNTRAFNGILAYSFLWDYGDSSSTVFSIIGQHVYNYRLPYQVKLTSTLYGWTSICPDYKVLPLDTSPLPGNAKSNSPVCLGSSLKLFVDTIAGATGYYWTGPNGFTSTVQNPILTNMALANQGTYGVRVIVGQCSSAVANVNVGILSPPSASNNGPLCAGLNLNLAVTNIPGANYTWTGPKGFTSLLSSPTRPNINVADSGDYSVSITLSGCGTIGPFTTHLSVKAAPPAPTAGNNGPLCIGNTLFLTASGSTSGVYNWIGPNGFASNLQNPSRSVVQLTHSGNYSVNVFMNGCTSPPGTTSVVINNIPVNPVASSNSPLCLGQTLNLTSLPMQGAIYHWSGPNSFSSDLQNPERSNSSLADSGSYLVFVTLNGCSSFVSTTRVSVLTSTPSPIASSNGPLCPGQVLQLSASAISGATYSWSGPNNFSSSLQNPSISNIDSSRGGNYRVTALASGCNVSDPTDILVAVSALPSAPVISSNGPLCEGQSLHLMASPISDATYYWSGPSSFFTSEQNPILDSTNLLMAGQYSVFVHIAGCGFSPLANTNVDIRPIPDLPQVSSNSPICKGDTIELAAQPGATGPGRIFEWSGPNNFSDTAQNPKIAFASADNMGLYMVSVTDSGCKSLTSSATLSVVDIPNSPAVSSNAPLCEGNNLLLFASNIPGALFKWSGPDTFISVSQYPSRENIRQTSGGTYQVTAYVNGCPSLPSTTNIIVFPLPATPQISNNGPKCKGESISLSASLVPGASYSWSGPGGFNSVLQNPVLLNVTPSVSGTYTVVTISQNCVSLPDATHVLVNPIPAQPVLTSFPLNGVVCESDSILFFAPFQLDGSYDWEGPSGFISTAQNPLIRNLKTSASGPYRARLTKFGCTSPPGTVNVLVNALPVTSFISGETDVRHRDIKTYSVTKHNGAIYYWNISGGVINSGDSSNEITVEWGIAGGGTLLVYEVNPSGCLGLPLQLIVAIGNTIGLSNLEGTLTGNIQIFPNPACKQFTLAFESCEKAKGGIYLYNTLGEQVMGRSIGIIRGNQRADIDVDELPEGIYLVQIQSGNQVKSARVSIRAN